MIRDGNGLQCFHVSLCCFITYTSELSRVAIRWFKVDEEHLGSFQNVLVYVVQRQCNKLLFTDDCIVCE
jgi:hypothetical protein